MEELNLVPRYFDMVDVHDISFGPHKVEILTKTK